MGWVDTVVQGLLLGGLYALFATGLSLIFGVMRIVNLAHGDLSILAAFLAVVAVESLGLHPFAALLLVAPLMAGLGYGLQRLVLNRLLGRGILPPILVTFGLSIIIQNVLLEVFSADSRRLNPGGIETASVAIGGQLAVGWFPLLTLAVAVLVLLGLQGLIGRLAVGRALRATSDDQETAELMGIDNRRLYGLAMALSLGIVAVAGVFLGIRTTFTFASGPDRLLFAFEAVIIGGLGSLWGTLVGGAVLGVAQTVGAKLSPGWGILTGHLVFLAVLLFRPQGLFAKARRIA
ncbi:MAG TPA: branched-chain amino acid ABC transporter permease [Methylomirabilota bacterium]|jgi:branched-chain amino acid transport system permease protein|nr:branched-chain amino acid ABC transporter permease [Methylomirabilota bacterium]